MNPNPPMFPWIFNLEGTFLGFMDRTGAQAQYIGLEVDEESLSINVSGALCDRLKLALKPGDRIQCIGRSQLNFVDKAVHLEAYQIFTLPMSDVPYAVAAGSRRARLAS
jgi:hypothetical protein